MNPMYHPVMAHVLPPLLLAALLPFIAIAAIWTLIWNGVGLWHAARNNQKIWFLAILLINAIGIPAIVYLLWFRKDKQVAHVAPAPAPAPSVPSGE